MRLIVVSNKGSLRQIISPSTIWGEGFNGGVLLLLFEPCLRLVTALSKRLTLACKRLISPRKRFSTLADTGFMGCKNIIISKIIIIHNS